MRISTDVMTIPRSQRERKKGDGGVNRKEEYRPFVIAFIINQTPWVKLDAGRLSVRTVGAECAW